MLCDTIREHLNRLSDGERAGDWRQTVAVFRHCLSCLRCRRYARQLRQLRQVTRHLPPQLPASVQTRLFAQLAGQMPDLHPADNADLPKLTFSKETQMRKRLTLATCAMLALAVTGTLATQLLRHKAGFVIEDRRGHTWHITSDYRGSVKLYDPQGAIIGATFNHQRSATAGGTVELDVAGAHYQLHPGKQEIRDSDNALIGFAELTSDDAKTTMPDKINYPVTLLILLQQSEAEEVKYGGASGLSANPLGAHGWNKALGVEWKARGQVKVRVLNAANHQIGEVEGVPLTDKLRHELGAQIPPAVPVFTITVNGKTHREQGYGRHEIKNAAGKRLLILEVQPLAPATTAESDADSTGTPK